MSLRDDAPHCMYLFAGIHALAPLLEKGLDKLQILRLTAFETLAIVQDELRVGPATDLFVDIRDTDPHIRYVLQTTDLSTGVSYELQRCGAHCLTLVLSHAERRVIKAYFPAPDW